MKRLILALVLALSTPAFVDDWTRAQKGWYGAFLAANVVDIALTVKTLDGGATEINPLLGPSPSTEEVIGFKVVGVGLLTLLLNMDAMDDSRSYVLGFLTVGQVAVDINNYNTMLSIGASF